MKKKDKQLIITALILLLGNFFIWQSGTTQAITNTEYYFLDVGQGDSELLYLPGGVKILIDAGNNDGAVVRELQKILPMNDRYIDIAVMTHPQRDHFGGIINLLDSYEFGLLIDNGRKGVTKTYDILQEKIKESGIKTVSVAVGDEIRYKDVTIQILNPTPESRNMKDINDSCVVMRVKDKETKSLFTCDIGEQIENALRRRYDISAQILKVAHHGSRFSSSNKFLETVQPLVSVIEVGAKNTYGHPKKEVLERLAMVGTKIVRTDDHGTIRITNKNNTLHIAQIK